MFVDRVAELAWLEEGWGRGSCQFRILYGRRRVGKSRLLDEFKAGKRQITYQAVEGTTADHLRDLTASILAVEDDPVLRAAPLGSWDAALAYVARLARSGPLLFIFDEYQYAAQADPTLASRLQRWVSREVADLPLYLVLCGSYVRYFVESVLVGPLYGRHTGIWQLAPLGYREVGEFFPKWSAGDRIRVY
ncbi:MAG TPA: ATP-binding protein, partial [Chloroflexota bacterium]